MISNVAAVPPPPAPFESLFLFKSIFFLFVVFVFAFVFETSRTHNEIEREEERESQRAKEIERVENVHFICHKFSRLRFHIFCATWTAATAAAAQSVAFSLLILCAAQNLDYVCDGVYARAVMSSENCIFFNSCFKYFSSSRFFFFLLSQK